MDPGRTPNCWLSRSTSSTSFKPFGRSHCTCSASVGQAPVEECTCAASLNFSSIVLAAAGWMNLPDRVPVFAKPHEGSSIRRLSSAFQTISVCLFFIVTSSRALDHAALQQSNSSHRLSLPLFFKDGLGKFLGPPPHCGGVCAGGLIPSSLQHRHLDGEIAQSRRLRRAKQYLQPRPLRRQAIQQRVLASPTHNKQPLQILPGNRSNRSQHLCIALGHAVKYHVCDKRNITLFP